MIDVYEAVIKRRSVRNFLDKQISPEVEQRLTDALIWAPSAGNMQARKFYFIHDVQTKAQLCASALDQKFIAAAPLVIVACVDTRIYERYRDRGVHLYAIQDVAASIMAMMLVAVGEGLGSVWVGAFREPEVFEILSMPGNLRPVALVPVGYPERIPNPPPRFDKSMVVISDR